MEEILYITPAGNEYTEAQLRDKYGERFDVFVTEGLLKKKDILEPDTDLTLDTGLLEQQEIDIPETEVGKLLKATTLNLGSGLARIPTFVKEKVIATAAELSPTIKENLETLNQIPFEQREQVIDALGPGKPWPRASITCSWPRFTRASFYGL